MFLFLVSHSDKSCFLFLTTAACHTLIWRSIQSHFWAALIPGTACTFKWEVTNIETENLWMNIHFTHTKRCVCVRVGVFLWHTRLHSTVCIDTEHCYTRENWSLSVNIRRWCECLLSHSSGRLKCSLWKYVFLPCMHITCNCCFKSSFLPDICVSHHYYDRC